MNRSNLDQTRDDPHAWTRQRLVPFEVGLLDDAEEQRIRAHLEGCGECSERLRILREEAREAGRENHIPARIMATWPKASARLQGLERAMVERHLARCADCREDLLVLGFEPVLTPSVSAAEIEQPRVVPFEPNRRRQRPERILHWRQWTLGSGWAAAAALTFVLLRNPGGLRVASGDGDGPRGDTPSAGYADDSKPPLTLPEESPTAEEPVGHDRGSRKATLDFAYVATTEATKATRGLPRDMPLRSYPVPPAGRELSVAYDGDLGDRPDDAQVTIILRAPDGSPLAQFETVWGEMKNRRVLNFNPGSFDYVPGEYMLRVLVAATASAPADSVTELFVLR